MSSFATIFSIAQKSKNVTVGLTNKQYSILSEIFPYFEKNSQKYLIEARICGPLCHQKEIEWRNLELLKGHLEDLVWDNQGLALNFGGYLNMPNLYKKHLNFFKSEVFKIRPEFVQKAQEKLDKYKNGADAIIGIHGRLADYSGHLRLYGQELADKNYYKRAMDYFRNKYENPVFLVTSDNPSKILALKSKPVW